MTTRLVAPLDLTLDIVAAIWAVRRFKPGASEASVQYVDPRAAAQPGPGTLLIGIPNATRHILPQDDPDGTPGSCFRTVVERYCPGRTREAIEPLVRVVEHAMKAEAGVDPEAPVDLRDGDLPTIFRGMSRTFVGCPDRDDRVREAMEPVFDALYALLRVFP